MNSTPDSTTIAPVEDSQCKAHSSEADAGTQQSEELRADPWDQWKSARDLH